MSKLYTEYLKLKNKDVEKIYLFKSGIFYIALDKDAEKLSEALGFKLTNLNNSIVKCGFPQNRIEFYTEKLNLLNITFEIVDSNYSKIDSYSSYINNEKLKNIVTSISFKDSFEFLGKINLELKEIYKV